MKKLTFPLLAGLILLAACLPGPGVVTVTPGPSATPSVTPTPLGAGSPTNPPDAALTPLPTLDSLATAAPTASATPASQTWIAPRYLLDTLIDYDAKTVSVKQTINYINQTGQALDDIVLAVVPNLWAGAFRLEKLTIHNLLEPDYRLDGQRLTVQLPESLPPEAGLIIQIDYTLNLPAHNPNPDPNTFRPDIFGYTFNQLNLVDWYPFIVPYENGWVLSDPWFYGEHLVYDLADYEVKLSFSNPSRAPRVASSGAVTQSDDNSTTYSLTSGRTFALSMSREYLVASATVNNIQVDSYYFPVFEAGGKAALEATLQAVATYEKLFGPYRHQSLAVVQGDFNDGMEYDGLYFLSNAFYNLYDNTERNYLVMIAAHETCHMWWFGAVGNDQSNDPWLDESMATYCERLFYEDNYPAAVDWWWSYRVTFYSPEGKIDNPVASYGGFTPYTNATYRRGALFLENLRQRMGDEAFLAFLKDYYTQMSGKRATSSDFFEVLAEHNQVDVADLLADYFAEQP